MSGQRWEVVGGAESGGILVRVGQELGSDKKPDRLATGSLLEELNLEGGRLHFRRLNGSGPQEGWVSIKVGQKDLVVKVERQSQVAANALTAPTRSSAPQLAAKPPAKSAVETAAPRSPVATSQSVVPAQFSGIQQLQQSISPAPWLSPLQSAAAAKAEPAKAGTRVKGQISEQAQIEIARERVKHVCKLHGLRLFPVEADGNCQFRALAHEFLGAESLHVQMREKIVSYLLRQQSRYRTSEMLEGHTVEEYCAKMLGGSTDKKTGKLRPTWGDFLTLQAACDMEGTPITLLNNHPNHPIKTFYPRSQKTNRPIVLTYILRLHYDATMPDPEAETYYGDENTQLFSKFHRLEELS